MKHSDFHIGLEFMTETGRWRCTDVGTRTIAAIKLDQDDDPSWYDGPPYAIVEYVFDEHDLEDCRKALPRTSKRFRADNSGASQIRVVSRKKIRVTGRP